MKDYLYDKCKENCSNFLLQEVPLNLHLYLCDRFCTRLGNINIYETDLLWFCKNVPSILKSIIDYYLKTNAKKLSESLQIYLSMIFENLSSYRIFQLYFNLLFPMSIFRRKFYVRGQTVSRFLNWHLPIKLSRLLSDINEVFYFYCLHV